jgi:hypothetical protein
MHVRPEPRGVRRRVAAFHEADGSGEHRLAFRWDERSDSFERTTELRDEPGLQPYADFIARLVREGDPEPEAVRRKALAFCRTAP